jgi:hypothetical protein
MERVVGVFEDAGRWTYRCMECGARGTLVETRIAARVAYRAHRQRLCEDAAEPVKAAPVLRSIVITTEQIQGVLDRIQNGSTVKAEAVLLGMGYQVLRRVLQQVMGIDAYLSLMAAGLVHRAKLPPSRSFLSDATTTTATGTDQIATDPVPFKA